jgi:hypothetical protein
VPVCDHDDFLPIFELSDEDRGKAEWDDWQEELQEWRQLLREAGYRTLDVPVTVNRYRRFLDENEEAGDSLLRLWDCAAQIVEERSEEIVLSLGSLLISAWDLEEFPCVGGPGVEDPTARVEVDLDAQEAHLSILMLGSDEQEGTFEELCVLDLPPELLQQLANDEVPWYGCTVYRHQEDSWQIEFYTADTEEELVDTRRLLRIKRVLENLGEEKRHSATK